MRLSTRGRYGLRASYELAANYGRGPLSLKVISEREAISEHYLEQLMGALRKAGLVNSVRGAQGGYELQRRPSEISIGDVIRALEGPIAPVDCVDEVSPAPCDHVSNCVTRMVWEKLRDSIVGVLDGMTLEDLCQEAKRLQSKQEQPMYYI